MGQRRFQSDSCTEVVGAAAVTIALLLSSGAEAASGAGATSGASATSSASGSAAVTRKATSEADAESTPLDPARRGEARASASEETGRWRVVLAAPSVSAGFGLLSQPSFGLGGAFALEDDDWRLFVGATWNFDVTVRQSNSTDQGAEVSRGTGRMGACRWLGRARFQWAPCAAVALHYLTARGVGSEVSPEVAHYPSVALGPSVLGRLRLSDVVGLAASLGLELQTARPRLVLEGLGEIEQIGVLELTSHASPLEFTEHSARLELLQTLLAGLTEAKREVFILAELEEMTVPEIAAALDIPLNTAYSRLRHARQEFEAALARHTAASKTRGSA